MHATVFKRRPTTVAKLSSQPLVLTRCSEHTARCRPPAPRLASSARGPGAHLGYRTTHGTEPTLGSILWRYGTRRPESGALVAALAYDPLSCALLLFAAVMGVVLLHLVCLHAHTLSRPA